MDEILLSTDISEVHISEHWKNLSIENIEGEEWRDISEYQGFYQVSNYARIKSFKRIGNSGDCIRTQSKDKAGYLKVVLKKLGVAKYLSVHRLVAFAFIPNPENKPFINHKDGNKQNNLPSNLEWCTSYENYYHAKNVLRHNFLDFALEASRIAAIKNKIFTDDKIKDILIKRSSGLSAIQIANEYNTNRSTITKIIRENKNSKKFNIIIPNNLPIVKYKSKYETSEIRKQASKKRSKRITVETMSGKFIGEFSSKREAARQLNLDRKSINLVLNGDSAHHKGYTFQCV